jgi:hypothetical protein
MSRGVLLATLAICALGVSELHADMGVPGFKRIEQRMQFDNLSDFPDYDFFLGLHYELDPANKGKHGSGPLALRSGEAVSHLSFFNRPDRGQYVIVAVPRSKSTQFAWSATWETVEYGRQEVLHSEPFVLHLETAIFVSPREYDLHHYRVNMSGGQLSLEHVGVEDNGFVIGGVKLPTWTPGVALSALFVGVVLWCIRRQRRPQASTGHPAVSAADS